MRHHRRKMPTLRLGFDRVNHLPILHEFQFFKIQPAFGRGFDRNRFRFGKFDLATQRLAIGFKG